MGWFYTGYDFLNRKNGYFKIGETGEKYLSTRLGQIRLHDAFECLGFLRLINDTKSERLYVESYVRMMMEREEGLTHVQNDHFCYEIRKGEKHAQAEAYAQKALAYAKVACTFAGIEYVEGYKQYKRR